MPEEKQVPLPVCRSVWALLEKGGRVTFDRISDITGKPPLVTVRYLDLLLRQGYVALVGVQKAVSGETICMFELIRRTGRNAPYVDERGVFIDPNVPTRGAGQKWALPSLGGLCRFHAERFDRPFTRKELSRKVSEIWPAVTGTEFNSAWYHLRYAKEIEEQPDGTWEFIPNGQVKAIREYFRAHLGETIIAKDLRRQFPRIKHHYKYRQALDLLAAEGFSVRMDIRGDSNLTKYRVDPADSPQEAVA
jgi:hypothetical protein